MKSRALAVVAVLALCLLAACGSSKKNSADDGATVPKGFDVPAGVTLTKPGTQLTEGKAASVVFHVGDRASSAITVRLTSVEKGDIGDFKFFSLPDDLQSATPFYVRVTVKNEGPAGIGGAALPIYAHASDNTITLPNPLVGTFAPCPHNALPSSFLPGASANLCLIYLVRKGTALQSVDLQTGSQKDAITWHP